MELLLIRHAEPIRLEVDAGPANPPLHARGEAQAERLADWLAGERIDRLYTSPLRRAQQTADRVAARTGLVPEVDDGLAEYDRNLSWYVPIEELRSLKDERWEQVIGGEYFGGEEDRATFSARITGALDAIIAANAGRRVAAVCHGGVINVFAAGILRLTGNPLFFLPHYTSISRIAASRDGTRSIVSLNETAHLRGL